MPLLPVAYTAVMAESLYAHSVAMAGIYDLDLAGFTFLHPAGVQLLAYPSEEAFLADPSHSLPMPPWTSAQWQCLCDITQHQRVARLNAEVEQKLIDRTNALLLSLDQLEKRGDELALQAEQKLGELKSRFVSMASHEFCTPLTAVLTIDMQSALDQGTHRHYLAAPRHARLMPVNIKTIPSC